MALAMYLDVHVPRAIADQVRRRGVDVLTAIEDDATTVEIGERSLNLSPMCASRRLSTVESLEGPQIRWR